MAKFIFRLNNLLSLKIKLEEQARNEYSQAMAALQREEDRLNEMQQSLLELSQLLRKWMEGSLPIAKIRQTELAIDAWKDKIEAQQQIVKAAEQQVKLRRHHLDEAMKERKIYEKLKEKEFEKFLAELNHQEMKEIDELVSYTYGKKTENEE